MSQSLLLQIARESITEVFEAQNTIDRETLLKNYPVLNEPLASFVSIYLDEELRGAQGSVFPSRSLLDDIIHNAKSAAFEDPRFSPLKTSEYLHAKIELSLLTPPEELQYTTLAEIQSQVRPCIDGMIIALDEKRSAFLPQIWTQLEEFETFFSQLLKEADLSYDDLSSHPKIFTFQIEKQIDEPIIK